MKKNNMKNVIVALLVLLLVVTTFAGCGGGQESTENITPKDTLLIGQGDDITALDPHLSNEYASISVYGQIFDTLVSTNSKMEIEPCLAESWELLSDTQLKFNLRKDVKFQNGDPFTAADVKFSIERIIKSPYVSYVLDFVSSVEQVDEYTVIVNMNAPFGPALAHFSHPSAAIVPKTLVEADAEAFALSPVGTGPYKFVEWKHGEYVTLEAYEEYFQGAPITKNVKISIMPENSQRYIALEGGEIDIAYDISPNDVSKAEENSALNVMSTPSLSCMYLTMNTAKKGPLADKMVRKAIESAIDKESIISAVAYGNGQVANLIIPPGAIGYSDKVKSAEYNLEKAKQYLAKSKYPSGCELSLWVDDNATKLELCNILQNQLSQIGIDVKIEVMELGSLISKLDSGSHDMVLENWTTTAGDANYTLYGIYYSTTSAYEGNDSFYKNAEADKLITEGRSKSDIADRMIAYDQLYTILMDDIPYIPIYYPNINVAMTKKVEGFAINPKGNHVLRNVTIYE